jgi:hypothetical protein
VSAYNVATAYAKVYTAGRVPTSGLPFKAHALQPSGARAPALHEVSIRRTVTVLQDVQFGKTTADTEANDSRCDNSVITLAIGERIDTYNSLAFSGQNRTVLSDHTYCAVCKLTNYWTA